MNLYLFSYSLPNIFECTLDMMKHHGQYARQQRKFTRSRQTDEW